MTRGQPDDLERALGYKFRDAALLDRALTHCSAITDRDAADVSGDNEQFEYLGDAILGLLVSEHLVRAFPRWSEGQLSKGRARLVNGAALCAAARRLEIGNHLNLGRGEEKTGGREKPALLADAFEAVIAAIYLDAGLETTRAFVSRALIEPAIATHGERLEHTDYKSALQELLQARGLPVARYEVVREAGPDHQKTFWVEANVPNLVSATGTGPNKKEAEQAAAERALEQLRGQPA